MARLNKGARTRRVIVKEAMQLASSLGFEGLSIGALASSLGMSKSGLFGHFRSKGRLQLAVLEASREAIVEKVIRPAVREPRGEPRVQALVENWLAWASEEPGGCVFVAASAELAHEAAARSQ